MYGIKQGHGIFTTHDGDYFELHGNYFVVSNPVLGGPSFPIEELQKHLQNLSITEINSDVVKFDDMVFHTAEQLNGAYPLTLKKAAQVKVLPEDKRIHRDGPSAYWAGWRAHRCGVAKCHNPYANGPGQEHWHSGWQDRENSAPMPETAREKSYYIHITHSQLEIIHKALKEHHQTAMDQVLYNDAALEELEAMMDLSDPSGDHIESPGVNGWCL